MRKLMFILIGVILLTFVGCSNGENKTIEPNTPNLTISYDNKNIPVKKGGYEWTIANKSIIADTSSPQEIGESMKGHHVLPEATLNLEFIEKPNKVSVIYWGESKNRPYTSIENTITVPKEEGTYIFEIIGEWEQGKVSYITKTIVKNN